MATTKNGPEFLPLSANFILSHLILPEAVTLWIKWDHCRAKFIQRMQFVLVPAGSDHKDSAFRTGDPVLIPGSGRSLGKGNSNPLQYSCLTKEPGGLQSRGSQKAGHG